MRLFQAAVVPPRGLTVKAEHVTVSRALELAAGIISLLNLLRYFWEYHGTMVLYHGTVHVQVQYRRARSSLLPTSVQWPPSAPPPSASVAARARRALHLRGSRRHPTASERARRLRRAPRRLCGSGSSTSTTLSSTKMTSNTEAAARSLRPLAAGAASPALRHRRCSSPGSSPRTATVRNSSVCTTGPRPGSLLRRLAPPRRRCRGTRRRKRLGVRRQ